MMISNHGFKMSMMSSLFLLLTVTFLPVFCGTNLYNNTFDTLMKRSRKDTAFKPSSEIIPRGQVTTGIAAEVDTKYQKVTVIASGKEPIGVTLEKRLRSHLLVQVSSYLSTEELVLVMQAKDKDICQSLGRVLYMKNIRTMCTTVEKLEGHHPAIVFIANEQDTGKAINNELQEFSAKFARGDVLFNRVAVVLFSSTIFVKPAGPNIRYCIVEMKVEGVEFREVFTFGPDSSIPVEEVVGIWNPLESSQFLIPDKDTLNIPNDFFGNTVRIAFVEAYPETIKNYDSLNRLKLTGYTVDIMKVLQRQLNFTIEWIVTEDNQFGVPLANGSFTGLVGMLQEKKADMAIPGLGITKARLPVMDFSPPVDFGAIRLLIFKGSHSYDAIQWSTYLAGFQGSVWVAVLILWVIMSLGLALVSYHEDGITISDSFFTLIAIMTQQGSDIQPQSRKGRLVFLSFWIGCLILYTSYTASLTSQLAVVYSQDPFSSLYEALTTAGYSVAIQKGTGFIGSVKEMSHKNKAMNILYEQWMSHPELLLSSDEEGMSLIQSREAKYAYFKYTREISPQMENNCSFTWIGKAYFPDYTHIGYSKNLAYAQAISDRITRAASSGILSKLAIRWWGKETPCQTQDFQDLGFSKTLFAFLVLLTGAIVAVVFQITEKLIYAWQLRRMKATMELDHLERRLDGREKLTYRF